MMNAYELADYLDYKLENAFPHHQETIEMLRQQADRIAELEKELKRTKFAWNLAENEIERLVRQTKPLAFRTTKGAVAYCDPEYAKSQGWEALQNPAQTKPLSDDEIWEWFEKNTALTKESALMIGRAIEAKVRGEK